MREQLVREGGVWWTSWMRGFPIAAAVMGGAPMLVSSPYPPPTGRCFCRAAWLPHIGERLQAQRVSALSALPQKELTPHLPMAHIRVCVTAR